MARRAKDLGGAPAAEKTPLPKTGPTPELYANHTIAYLGAQSEVEQLQAKVNEAKGRARNILKVAKKDGCDTDAITLAVKLKKREAGEVISEYRTTVMILKAIDSPLGTQWDLFSDVEVRNVVDAEAAGYHTGKNGETATNNPHTVGSEEQQKWHSGWIRGQAKIMGVKPPAADDNPFVEDEKPTYVAAQEEADAKLEAAAAGKRKPKLGAAMAEALGNA